jgi:hypothetical protein
MPTSTGLRMTEADYGEIVRSLKSGALCLEILSHTSRSVGPLAGRLDSSSGAGCGTTGSAPRSGPRAPGAGPGSPQPDPHHAAPDPTRQRLVRGDEDRLLAQVPVVHKATQHDGRVRRVAQVADLVEDQHVWV